MLEQADDAAVAEPVALDDIDHWAFSRPYGNGTLTERPLERVTSLMSARKFDFPAARQEVWDMMQ